MPLCAAPMRGRRPCLRHGVRFGRGDAGDGRNVLDRRYFAASARLCRRSTSIIKDWMTVRVAEVVAVARRSYTNLQVGVEDLIVGTDRAAGADHLAWSSGRRRRRETRDD